MRGLFTTILHWKLEKMKNVNCRAKNRFHWKFSYCLKFTTSTLHSPSKWFGITKSVILFHHDVLLWPRMLFQSHPLVLGHWCCVNLMLCDVRIWVIKFHGNHNIHNNIIHRGIAEIFRKEGHFKNNVLLWNICLIPIVILFSLRTSLLK